jgi:hypothetical protein
METRVLKDTHLKMIVSGGDKMINVMMWRATSHQLIKRGELVDIAIRPEISNYNGLSEIQGTFVSAKESSL